MDREKFNDLIIEDLVDIVKNEIQYLEQTDKAYKVSSPFDIEKEGKTSKELHDKLEEPLKTMYYLYDRYKLYCKDYLGNHAIDLDRHKLTTVFLCVILKYKPIKVFSCFKRKTATKDLILANYRVAFRFACAYASRALYNSFIDRIDEYSELIKDEQDELIKQEYQEKINSYIIAKEQLKINGGYVFPETRKGLSSYVDNYIMVLYLQFKDALEFEKVPYAFISDTFYWLDVYNKIRLGIKVEPHGYENGLNKFAPTDNTQSQEENEVTVTETTEVVEPKTSTGKKNK